MNRLNVSLVTVAVSLSTLAAWKPAPAPLMTVWGEKVTPENAWREYPRPQLVRKSWTNLNGLWEYAVTAKAGEVKNMPNEWNPFEREDLAVERGEVLVPYSVGSALSGVSHKMAPSELLWYRRTIDVAKKPGERTILHFEGVDFRTQVFLNGVEIDDVPHEGGQTPFAYDITDFAKEGANELILSTWDATTDFFGALGKQTFNGGGCSYSRVSGIWQTVWLETVPATYLTDYYTTNVNLEKGTVDLVVNGVESVADRKAGVSGTVRVLDGAKELAKASFVFGETVTLKLPTPVRAWTPESPHLYTLKFAYGRDAADGYFAMRTFEKKRDANGIWRFALNGKFVFLQGPLDQGWWPDGFLTPPSEEAMIFDIRTLKDLGFNSMRKHIKVEPARYYWLCDKLGMMVLQDMPSGTGNVLHRYQLYRDEFKRMVDALRVFPSIVIWGPYNEGWGQPGPFLTASTLAWIKRYDPSRLVNGPSGWNDYGCTAADTIDLHNYRGPGMHPVNPDRISFLGEFGGLAHIVSDHLWKKGGKDGWGYGGMKDTSTRADLEKTYLGLIEKLACLAENGLAGSVYTQTTDVEVELNGYLTYDRKVLKFDKDVLRKAHEAVYAAADAAATTKLADSLVFPRKSEWAYTFDKPADGWQGAGFDDAAWLRGKGGFGHGIGWEPYAVEWKTSDFWARRHFTLGKLDGITSVQLDMFHDEDVEVYVNGALVLTAPEYSNNYMRFPIRRAEFLKVAKTGDNVIAVHVKQTQGGQYFDAALLVR